jgi:sugar phosphate isomerase/epimerase
MSGGDVVVIPFVAMESTSTSPTDSMMCASTISRRAFLTAAGAAPLAASLAGRAAFAQGRTVPVGLELYSVRDALTKDLTGTVRAVAKLGYEVVEFYSPYYEWTPAKAGEVRKLLDELGIKCLSTHNSNTAFLPENLQKAIDLNQAIGSKSLVMASPGKVADLDGWKALADRLNAAAEKLAPLGMTAGFHNHALEWRPVDGQRPMDILASRTQKHNVVLQLDVGTCVEAGADPVAWVKAHPGRIKSMHCKDWSKAKGYAVLFGEGDAPWAPLLQAAETTGGVEFYLIEQEEGPAEEQLKRAEQCLANWKKLKR